MPAVLALDLIGWHAACADIADARLVSLEAVSHPRFGQAPDWKPGKVPRKILRAWLPPDQGEGPDSVEIVFVRAPAKSWATFRDVVEGVVRRHAEILTGLSGGPR